MEKKIVNDLSEAKPNDIVYDIDLGLELLKEFVTLGSNILLKNLMFYGFHGAFEHERELGQRYYLDVQMEVDFDKAALSDDLSDAVNYVEIYNLIKDIVENKRFCDLVVGDKLYIYFFYNKNLATRKIFEIIKTEKLLMLECEYNEFSNSLFN